MTSVTCDEFLASAHDFVWERLDAARRDACRAHLRDCASCGSRFARAWKVTCRDVAEFLAEYLDGALDGDRRDAFEQHLVFCEDCAAYLDGYRKAVAVGREVLSGERSASEAVPEGLIDAILAARAREEREGRGGE